jgi:hypothetical protein
MEVKVSKRADTIPAQKAAGADQVPYENLNIFHDFIKNEVGAYGSVLYVYIS